MMGLAYSCPGCGEFILIEDWDKHERDCLWYKILSTKFYTFPVPIFPFYEYGLTTA